MSMKHLGFVKCPSSIPIREPIILVHGEQQVVFNTIKDNGNGFDLLMEYEPYSLVAENLELSDSAKEFMRRQLKVIQNEK